MRAHRARHEVRCMRELLQGGAVAHRKDMRGRRLQLIIDLHAPQLQLQEALALQLDWLASQSLSSFVWDAVADCKAEEMRGIHVQVTTSGC